VFTFTIACNIKQFSLLKLRLKVLKSSANLQLYDSEFQLTFLLPTKLVQWNLWMHQ